MDSCNIQSLIFYQNVTPYLHLAITLASLSKDEDRISHTKEINAKIFKYSPYLLNSRGAPCGIFG